MSINDKAVFFYEALVDNKDVRVMQISNLANNFWCYVLTPNLSMNLCGLAR